MDNQIWPPAPNIPPPEKPRAVSRRTLTSVLFLDAVVGSIFGFVIGIPILIAAFVIVAILVYVFKVEVPQSDLHVFKILVVALAAAANVGLGVILWRRWPVVGVFAVVGVLPLTLFGLLLVVL